MSFENIITCSLADLNTESDVEQKFILPLLVGTSPIGLNYNTSNFLTKPNIKGLKIDKGISTKLYYPDYVIINSALPLLIIEAKRRGEDLHEAFREARLYCLELNAQFPHGINPCKKIIVSNGEKTYAGYFDSDKYEVELNFDVINAANPDFYDFIQFASKENTFTYADEILKKLNNSPKFIRPLALLGGKAIQNEELQENTFGSTLSLEFRYLFNPENSEERKSIVLNAYVKTKRQLKQVDPIDKIIRATLPLTLTDIQKIEDTSQPIEVIKALQKRMKLKNQLLLLVGSVGSGKSTFTDYLKEVALDLELKQETVWVSFNLNQAPLSRDEIYIWLKEQVIEKLRLQNSDIDFDEFSVLQKLYSVEMNSVRKTYAPLLGESSLEYKKILAENIQRWKEDLDLTSKAFTRYLCTERAKLFIVVLDNTDKRDLQDQLLMFEVASWLKEKFNCLVFLPLRDTTYDNFRKHPPLDTVIKDFVFRIDPPLLKEVIMARIKYALREMSKESSKLSFNLPNGIIIEYPASDQGYYLASISRSLFESVYFSRLITGIAGRDIRKGLEIFLDFCKSGHLNETLIFHMRQSKGQYLIPNHLISRIILRGSMKYYSEQYSNVKNIFTCNIGDANPDPFARLSLLKWLDINFKKTGPSKNIGYHKIHAILSELVLQGHSEAVLNRELEYLIANKYIVTESQSEHTFTIEDLVSISPSGITLLMLLNDVNYLSSCSEDLYFNDQRIAELIYNRLAERTGFSLYSIESTIENSKDLIEYLNKYKAQYFIKNTESFANLNIPDLRNLDNQSEIINKIIQQNNNLFKQTQYPFGTIIEGQIVSIKEYGIFVEFGLESVGFVHISEFNFTDIAMEDLEVGDELKLKVKKFSSEHQKYELEFFE